jgi:hypothetical protein
MRASIRAECAAPTASRIAELKSDEPDELRQVQLPLMAR